MARPRIFTPAQIQALRASRRPQAELAAVAGISVRSVAEITRGAAYADVPEVAPAPSLAAAFGAEAAARTARDTPRAAPREAARGDPANAPDAPAIADMPAARARGARVSDGGWTGDLERLLTGLWRGGHSSQRIARVLGTSRNAVIGKARRLGLDARSSPVTRGGAARKVGGTTKDTKGTKNTRRASNRGRNADGKSCPEGAAQGYPPQPAQDAGGPARREAHVRGGRADEPARRKNAGGQPAQGGPASPESDPGVEARAQQGNPGRPNAGRRANPPGEALPERHREGVTSRGGEQPRSRQVSRHSKGAPAGGPGRPSAAAVPLGTPEAASGQVARARRFDTPRTGQPPAGGRAGRRPAGLGGAAPRTCQWPHGDPGSPEFQFCGAESVPGKPYCPAHCARAYLAPEAARRPREAAE